MLALVRVWNRISSFGSSVVLGLLSSSSFGLTASDSSACPSASASGDALPFPLRSGLGERLIAGCSGARQPARSPGFSVRRVRRTFSSSCELFKEEAVANREVEATGS